MTKPALLIAVGFFFLGFCGSSAFADEDVSYAPKLAFRTDYEMLSNSGTLGGSATMEGNLDLEYLYYLTGQFCIYVGYHYDFDFSAGATPLYGFNLGLRNYFSGLGTLETRELPYMRSEIRDQHAYYYGAEIAQRNYSSGASATTGSSSGSTSPTAANNPINNISGSYMNINLLVGTDWRLSRHIDFTGELNYGFMTFASTDQRVKIKGTAVQFGINYVF